MSEPITIPPLEEIAERLRTCRAEMAALRKLYRLAKAACDVKSLGQRRAGGHRKQDTGTATLGTT